MGGTHLLVYSIGLITGICVGALATRHPFRKRHVDQRNSVVSGHLVGGDLYVNDSKKAKRCESCGSPN